MQPNPTQPNPGRFQTFQCDDTHQQAAMLQAWNQSYCQLSAGNFEGSVTDINTGAVRVIVERINRVRRALGGAKAWSRPERYRPAPSRARPQAG